MIVTDKEYMIEDQLLLKLDLMVKRLKGSDDVILIVDGDEGQGKTEFAFGVCYYMGYKLKRDYQPSENIFFDLDEMIRYASYTKEKIIHFDEGALGLLRTHWQKENQQKFLQLVMVARKKKHFIVICIPKFHRLPPYIIEDRSIGLIHVYSHKNMYKGRYCYFTKKAKAKLYEDYKKKNIQSYQKNFSFRGKFIEASKRIFTNDQIEEYEKKKDDAILSVGNKTTLTDRQRKWVDQRNKLIKYLKDKEKLSMKKLSDRLKELGVNMEKTNVVEICRSDKLTATPL